LLGHANLVKVEGSLLSEVVAKIRGVGHRYPVKKSSGRAAEMRPDGRPVGTPFKKGQSGNPDGLKPGTIHLSTRVRRLLCGDEKLPDAIAETIRKAVGDDRHALDAMVIVGLLQALQGDEKWAKC
jgi:hypothetical protein